MGVMCPLNGQWCSTPGPGFCLALAKRTQDFKSWAQAINYCCCPEWVQTYCFVNSGLGMEEIQPLLEESLEWKVRISGTWFLGVFPCELSSTGSFLRRVWVGLLSVRIGGDWVGGDRREGQVEPGRVQQQGSALRKNAVRETAFKARLLSEQLG